MSANSQAYFARAQAVMPGGVNSPVRACLAVGREPLFIASAEGAYIFDIDENAYIDYVGSWGPMILGHSHPKILEAVGLVAKRGLSFGAPTRLEVLLAEKVVALSPGVDMVRMVNSGTEAVMSALRLARAYTGRNLVIKFAGCYHGHSDSMLVKAGSGALTSGQPDSLGVPPAVAADTLVANYNDLAGVEALFEQYPDQVACLIVEPLAANMGLVLPEPGFLAGLRELCTAHGALLVFDEVITGFRLGLGGAQQHYGVQADLVTYGKVIGGGMPVGAYAGRNELMQLVSPSGGVYQAGTLSGNPVAMAAGLAQLEVLEAASPVIYDQLEARARQLAAGIAAAAERHGVKACVTQAGSLFCCFFGIESARDYAEVKQADTAAYARYYQGMLAEGVYLAPSQFESGFISAAHDDEDIEVTIAACDRVLAGMQAGERP